MKHLSAFIVCLVCILTLFQCAIGEGEADRADPSGSFGTLVEVCYTNSGDEYGNTYSEQISRAEDGALILTVRESISASQPVTVSRYSAADDSLERIAAIADTSAMAAWADRPDELEVFDASHPYLILEYLTDDGSRTSYRISGYIEMTETESEAYDSVLAILRESLLPERLLETLQVEQ